MTPSNSPAADVQSAPSAAGDTTATLAVTVYGTPAPQGSKRHVGRGIMVESSAKVKPWREAVKHAALAAMNDEPWLLSGPLVVTVCFTLLKPASAPKRTRTWPSKRPDIDKLLRSSFDALGEAGVWGDDAQVQHLVAHKEYPGEHINALQVPGARLWISAVTT